MEPEVNSGIVEKRLGKLNIIVADGLEKVQTDVCQ
jgi:hypothetical protein